MIQKAQVIGDITVELWRDLVWFVAGKRFREGREEKEIFRRREDGWIE